MIAKTCHILTLTFILGFLVVTQGLPVTWAKAESLRPSELTEFVDEFLPAQMKEDHVPGAALVVVQDGQIIFSNGYGYADINNQRPIDPKQTLFRVASVSKVFTIAAILQLAEDGLVDLDSPVNKYLPGWQIENPFDQPLLIRHLLTHTDGFGTRDLGTFALSAEDLVPLSQVLPKEIRPPIQEPGTMIAYGSFGTALAGYLVEQVSGQPFADYMARHIFRPLGMTRSTFAQVLPADLAQKAATTYDYDDRTASYAQSPFLYLTTPPTGGLSVAPEDMAGFMITLLGSPYGTSKPVLSPEMTERMISRQFSPHPLLPGVTFGFMEDLRNGLRGLVRDGSGVGIRSQVYLLPEHNLGYFYVQNTRGDTVVNEFNTAFLNRFFPGAPTYNEPQTLETDSLNGHAGIYRPVQTPEYTLVKVEGFFSELRVGPGTDGKLKIIPPRMGDVFGGFEAASEWEQIGPRLFRQVGEEKYLAFDHEGGAARYLFSGSGYHGAYEKIPWYESAPIQLALLITYLLIFLSAIIIARRGLALIVSILNLIGLSGFVYVAFIKQVAGFPAFAFGISPAASIMLGLLVLSAVLTIPLAISTIRLWKNRTLSLRARIFHTAVTLAALCFIQWLDYWNLLGFRV